MQFYNPEIPVLPAAHSRDFGIGKTLMILWFGIPGLQSLLSCLTVIYKKAKIVRFHNFNFGKIVRFHNFNYGFSCTFAAWVLGIGAKRAVLPLRVKAHSLISAPRSTPAPRPPTPRTAPLIFPTPAHRSAPLTQLFGPLRSGFAALAITPSMQT